MDGVVNWGLGMERAVISGGIPGISLIKVLIGGFRVLRTITGDGVALPELHGNDIVGTLHYPVFKHPAGTPEQKTNRHNTIKSPHGV